PASLSADVRSELRAPETSPPPRRRARKKAAPRRWVREVQGIVALTAGVFVLVALAIFDPAVAPGEQSSMVGPVGIWLAWACFRSFGYAAFLFPLAAGVWGVSAFVRPLAARGWTPIAGLLVLLLAATGLLQQATDAFAAARVTHGGIVPAGGFTGWAAAAALHATIGNAGAWLLLLTAVPVGALLVTQTSCAVVTRLVSARLARLRKRQAAARPAPGAKGDAAMPYIAEASMETAEPTLPTIVEPARAKSTLMEKGLSWQETFDFGKHGAEAFQLPPVGLLQEGSTRRLCHLLPARDLRLRGVRRVQGQAASGPRQGRQRHARRGRPHRDAAPARGRRHRQRQVGRPELDDLLDPLQGDARRRALPHGGSQAHRALGVRGHSASAVAGGHRRQGGGRPAALDRRQDGRALQGAAAQAGAQHRGL